MKNVKYEDLINKTIEFYDKFNIDVDSNITLAVQSLMMPQFVKEYNDRNKDVKLYDNSSLATLGDSVCGVYLMEKEFKIDITAKKLTNCKEKLTNKKLNIIGEKLLKEHLFFTNNDLSFSNKNKEINNKKSYATAFEAFIGFIYLINKSKCFEILDEYIKVND